jgi:hypothetical protein
MRRRRDRISVAIGGAALLVSVLAIGGVFRWTQALVAVLVGGALVVQVSSRRKLDRVSPIIILIAIAIGLTALQLVPLPQAVLDALNPVGNGLRTDGAQLASTHPWSCISMDPGGTVRALVFFVILLGVAVLSLRVAASERGRFALMGGVAIVCGLAALVTGLHTVVNASSLYGLYEPVHAAPPVLGPLLNPNHLGCLMAFGATISIGLVFHEKQTPAWRAVWVVIAVGCAVIALASQSRGAAISLALGAAIASGILIGRGVGEVAGGARRVFRQLPIAFVMAVGLGLAVFSSAGDVADQLDRTTMTEVDHPTSKFAAWKASVQLVAETPWVGVGRGAVEPTFTRIFDGSAFFTFSHLENEYVSAIVEWGVPGALALALALAWCIIVALRRWRDGALAAGALGGVVGVMFQSSVDFGIQLLGLAVPVTVVACTLLVVPLRETSKWARLRVPRIGLVVALGVCAVLVMRPSARSLQEDHDRLLAKDHLELATLFQMIERHPLDYFPFGEAAKQMLENDDPRGVAFLNHALELHPAHPGLHRLAARLLAGTGRKDQATVEYSLAMDGTYQPHVLLTEITAVLPDAADAARAIPVDYFSPDSVLNSLQELKRDDVAQAWLARVVQSSNRTLALVDKLYNLAMARNDLDVAMRAANLRLNEQHTTTSRLMLAKVEFAKLDYAAVQKELADVQQWRGRIDERGDAWLLVCDTYQMQGQWDPALECLHHLDGSGLMQMRHDDIAKREKDIADHRTSEAKLKEIQDLEREMHLPVDTYLPVLPSNPDAPASAPGHGTAITNPITNPLKHSTGQGSGH